MKIHYDFLFFGLVVKFNFISIIGSSFCRKVVCLHDNKRGAG